MNIRYIGPFDAVEVGAQVFVRGEAVSVPSELAGSAPDPRLLAAQLELNATVEQDLALIDEIASLDRGSGLLAQDCFELVPAAKIKKGDES